jgi:acetyl-CoA/propionyl-CoA/long-chain acyl-CoA carboxylase, biotin carboxylase, biotin carboxyl carrier protein
VFSRILIANRAEIAVRIARTCKELGVASVAVHLPGVAPSDTYLNANAIIDAARSTGAEAVHPGYGFLAESAEFSQQVIDAGLVWIGPPPEAIRALGDKISARRIATAAGVPVVPGLLDPLTVAEEAREFGARFGFPVVIKASGGGGGRGMRVVQGPEDLSGAVESARRESLAYFGSSDVYVERYLEAPKHLEVQLLSPNPDEAMWLGVRDCSLQRRHQKLIEETPPPRFSERVADMGAAAVGLAKTCGYVGAGTVEMLVEASGDFYFLEVNSRLQVEHTVTEEVFGIDLVACQLAVAAGDPLPLTQSDLDERGHAIECRIYAEDPSLGFLPAPGVITRYVEPSGLGVRVDSGYRAGDQVPDAYDSLISKLVTWGRERSEARARMLRALDEYVVEGVATTIGANRLLVASEEFAAGTHTTRSIEGGALDELLNVEGHRTAATGDVLVVEGRPVRLWNPAMAGFAAAAVHGEVEVREIVAPMQGTILEVLVDAGRRVRAGEELMVLEAMKMETTIAAPASGSLAEVRVSAGQTVSAGEVLAVFE